MMLPDLKILRLDFCLRAESAVVLPPFLGATLRGAFGAAFKQVACFVPHRDCAACWFAEGCAYQSIFESPNFYPSENRELHPLLRGQKNLPQPFVLVPPTLKPKQNSFGKANYRPSGNFNEDYESNRFQQHDELYFSLILMGKAVHNWERVVVAARLLAENGLGEKCVSLKLKEAFAHDAQGTRLKIFSEDDPKFAAVGVAATSLSQTVENQAVKLLDSLERQKRESGEISQLCFEFLTPARIRINGRISTQINFENLLRKITERLEFLAFLYAEPSQRIDYRPLLAEAEQVSQTSNSLRKYEWKQFSNRQDRPTRRDVITGKMTFAGNQLQKFLRYLAAGGLLNVGSNTSYGLGRFIIKAS